MTFNIDVDVEIFRRSSVVLFFNTSEFSLLFHFNIKKMNFVSEVVSIFYYVVFQMLAAVLSYFVLRHVSQSGFLGQHQKESMEQCYYNLQHI